jgi:hypothetical protein
MNNKNFFLFKKKKNYFFFFIEINTTLRVILFFPFKSINNKYLNNYQLYYIFSKYEIIQLSYFCIFKNKL